MDVVNGMYAVEETRALEDLIWSYASFSRQLQELNLLTGLGEPKFNVDGTAFTDRMYFYGLLIDKLGVDHKRMGPHCKHTL